MKQCRGTFLKTFSMIRNIQSHVRGIAARKVFIGMRIEASVLTRTTRKPLSDISDVVKRKNTGRSLRNKNIPFQEIVGENVLEARNFKPNRSKIAAEGLSSALKRAKLTSNESCGEDVSILREEIERLKVVDLRQELRSHGLESKVYSKLRKAELVTLVLQRRGFIKLNDI
jgi:hypothetical protein